jgi:hypothetical protein
MAGHPLQTLPVPTTVPARKVQFSSCRFTLGPVEVMQSVFASQAIESSLLHVPSAMPLGTRSLQTPLVS